jgi:phosphonoacetaldehyde hydrolase
MMSKQLFVFDVAGTLVDLGSRAPVIAFQKAFADHGFFPTEAQIKKPMGKNKLEHIHDVLDEVRVKMSAHGHIADKIYESFKQHIVAAVKETNDPIPGVVEALESLVDDGHDIAFTTGYDAHTANLALEKLDAQMSFTVPLTTASDSPGRPTPHMIYRSMLLTETHDIDCVWKIGDTRQDWYAGSNAGIGDHLNIMVATGNFLGNCEEGMTYASSFHASVPDFVKSLESAIDSFRRTRVLTCAEVEHIVVDAIEMHAENYQFFEWEPVNKALKDLQALAQKRQQGQKS